MFRRLGVVTVVLLLIGCILLPGCLKPSGDKALFQLIGKSRSEVEGALGPPTKVRKGANVNFADRRGNTPLISAALRGNIAVARFLVAKGADVNAVDRDGMTPLHGAAGRNNPELIRFLVEHKGNINASGKQGTPLQFAIRGKRDNAANQLRQLGARE